VACSTELSLNEELGTHGLLRLNIASLAKTGGQQVGPTFLPDMTSQMRIVGWHPFYERVEGFRKRARKEFEMELEHNIKEISQRLAPLPGLLPQTATPTIIMDIQETHNPNKGETSKGDPITYLERYYSRMRIGNRNPGGLQRERFYEQARRGHHLTLPAYPPSQRRFHPGTRERLKSRSRGYQAIWNLYHV
jgi:hypothetical protein